MASMIARCSAPAVRGRPRTEKVVPPRSAIASCSSSRGIVEIAVPGRGEDRPVEVAIDDREAVRIAGVGGAVCLDIVEGFDLGLGCVLGREARGGALEYLPH